MWAPKPQGEKWSRQGGRGKARAPWTERIKYCRLEEGVVCLCSQSFEEGHTITLVVSLSKRHPQKLITRMCWTPLGWRLCQFSAAIQHRPEVSSCGVTALSLTVLKNSACGWLAVYCFGLWAGSKSWLEHEMARLAHSQIEKETRAP